VENGKFMSKKILKRTFKRLKDKFDKDLKDFKSVYHLIEPVPGFLKSPMQEQWFFKAARKSPADATIVEIGSFQGRSTVSFALGCIGSKKKIYAIDLFEGDNNMYGSGDFLTSFKNNLKNAGVEEYVIPVKKHSLEVAATWTLPIDILFIDGSHEYEDVKADFEAFYPYVKKGGVIAFHDIKGQWVGVIKYWDEVQKKGVLEDIGNVSSLGFGVKR
jgi:predicted O-methyltransferase YrrM